MKSSPGTPSYKSQEEYYDDILALKKVLLIKLFGGYCILIQNNNKEDYVFMLF